MYNYHRRTRRHFTAPSAITRARGFFFAATAGFCRSLQLIAVICRLMQAAAGTTRDINNVAAKRGCATFFPPFSCNAWTPPNSFPRRRPFHNHSRSGVTACRRATLVTRTTPHVPRSASAWHRSPSAAGCAACPSRRPIPRAIRTRWSWTRSRPSRRAAAPSTRPTSAQPTAAATSGGATSPRAACSP